MPFPKKSSAVLFLTVFLIMCQPLFFSDGSEASSGTVVFSEVHPKEEAFVISNVSSADVDLNGWEITDGEGTLTFVSSLVIAAGGSLTVSKEEFAHEGTCILLGDPVFKRRSSLILADSGDELALYKGGKIVDSVCWGSSKGVEGWYGDPAECPSGSFLLRTADKDTDRPSDWTGTKRGWSNLSVPEEGFEAAVTPFSFPESKGEPILSEVGSAEESVDAAIYLMTSPELVSVMCQMAGKGVEGRVLVEGTPLGVDISTELSLLKALCDAGADVRIINPSGFSDYRYLYAHNKYLIIDGETVVVTSENWTRGNIGDGGNRGWGIVAESAELASYYASVFENDFSTDYGDVVEFAAAYPNAKTYSNLPEMTVPAYEKQGISATVFPVFSPDDSYGAMRSFIRCAEERVYAEQMDLGSTMVSDDGDTPVGWLADAAECGVDVKFILDSSQSNGGTHESYVNEIVNATYVKAVCVNGTEDFSLIHNKGVIADDSVWVGSVNWTANSFLRNRESALIVESRYVAEYYAGLFRKDFGTNMYTVEEEGLRITMTRVSTSSGPMMVLSVNGPDQGEYEWCLGDGSTRTSSENSILARLPAPGVYTATVRISGTDISCALEYEVEGNGNETLYTLFNDYTVCSVFVLAVGLAVALVKRRAGTEKDDFGSVRYR